MKTPRLAHLIKRPTPYVSSHEHGTIDHLQRTMRAARKAHPSPVVVRVPPLVVDHVGGRK